MGNPMDLDFDINFSEDGQVNIISKNEYTLNFYKLLSKTEFINYLFTLIKDYPMYGYTKYRIRNEIEKVYAFLKSNGVV